jgi:hypothetical protein
MKTLKHFMVSQPYIENVSFIYSLLDAALLPPKEILLGDCER